MPIPNGEVIRSLESWLEDARKGDLQGIFVVGCYGPLDYDEEMVSDDPADLICEVRGAVIRMRLPDDEDEGEITQ